MASNLVRKFSSTSIQNAINHVTVIGGGLMGSGIAQVTAQSGLKATLVEVNQGVLKNTETRINDSLKRVAKKLHKDDKVAAEKFIAESLSRINFTVDLNSAVQSTDLVIEAIIENLELKRKLFQDIDTKAPEHTIFASNTSSFFISDISEPVKRLDRFSGLHFFNPVPVMRLLEVIRTPKTSDETHKKLLQYGKAVGKTTVTCKDTPGFIVNRLIVPLMAEAVRMVERGDATARDIDTALKLGAGYPMGPIELLDFTGVDTFKSIIEGWHKKFPDQALFEPVQTIIKLVEEGKLGAKSGQGFYTYKK